jgi:hypothetical protein
MSTLRLCTLDSVKEILAVRSGFTGKDTLLQKCVDISSIAIKDYIRREFDSKSYVEYFNTVNNPHKYPKKFYVKAFNLNNTTNPPVVVLSYARDWTLTPLEAGSDYFVDTDSGYIELALATTRGIKVLKISYTAGYVVDGNGISQVPDDIAFATSIQASFLYERISDNEVGQVNETTKIMLIAKLAKAAIYGVTPEAQNLVNKYRRILTGSM